MSVTHEQRRAVYRRLAEIDEEFLAELWIEIQVNNLAADLIRSRMKETYGDEQRRND